MTWQIQKQGKQRTYLVCWRRSRRRWCVGWTMLSLCSSFRLFFSLLILLFGSVLCVSFFFSFSGSLSLSLFLVFSFLCLVGYSDLLFRGQPRWQWNVREGWCGLRGLGLEVIPWWLFLEFCREFYSPSPLSCSGFSRRMLVMVSLTLMAHCGGEERLEQNGIDWLCWWVQPRPSSFRSSFFFAGGSSAPRRKRMNSHPRNDAVS